MFLPLNQSTLRKHFYFSCKKQRTQLMKRTCSESLLLNVDASLAVATTLGHDNVTWTMLWTTFAHVMVKHVLVHVTNVQDLHALRLTCKMHHQQTHYYASTHQFWFFNWSQWRMLVYDADVTDDTFKEDSDSDLPRAGDDYIPIPLNTFQCVVPSLRDRERATFLTLKRLKGVRSIIPNDFSSSADNSFLSLNFLNFNTADPNNLTDESQFESYMKHIKFDDQCIDKSTGTIFIQHYCYLSCEDPDLKENGQFIGALVAVVGLKQQDEIKSSPFY